MGRRGAPAVEIIPRTSCAGATSGRTDAKLRSAEVAMFDDVLSYTVDAWQRSVLFLDVMRQRAVQYEEHSAQTAPHVLDYEAELIADGRTLARPVNYALVR